MNVATATTDEALQEAGYVDALNARSARRSDVINSQERIDQSYLKRPRIPSHSAHMSHIASFERCHGLLPGSYSRNSPSQPRSG